MAHLPLPPIEEQLTKAIPSVILFPNVYKITLVGAEFVEASLDDRRAKALRQLVLDRVNPQEIMEFEW